MRHVSQIRSPGSSGGRRLSAKSRIPPFRVTLTGWKGIGGMEVGKENTQEKGKVDSLQVTTVFILLK